ncbi:glycosyltransferase [Reinekea blandensis]|uniref:Glycosyl transferase family 1 domain-containing protein n=1 Tax=Reinekea blandensis MED297 TaxID=314283 RepID=A4B942_9GAMM|nr:glycosyltransferase [Reinekea blandensis]EAR11143.1 hypothetical protein MED297_19687 [Reinekea sp. MED297] [Reinekea blandensis MED297]
MSKQKEYSTARLIKYLTKQEMVAITHTKLRKPIALTFYLLSKLFFLLGSKEKGVQYALKSRRVASINKNNLQIAAFMRSEWIKPVLYTLLPELPSGMDITRLNARILITAIPEVEENIVKSKGILIIKFSETFGFLAHLADLPRLQKYFHVVLEPSWVGYALPEILIWATENTSEKVFVMSAYHDDFTFIKSLNSNLVPCTIGPADWVNPTVFKPKMDADYKYDAVYLANYDNMKRVDRYLRAVVKLSKKHPGYKAALVCAGHGGNKQDLNNAIAWAKNKSNLSFFPGVPQHELSKIVAQSKVNALFSLREGANKGLAEGLWCNTPALLLKDCICGNHRHINAQTGLSVSDSSIVDALESFYLNKVKTDPRAWVEKNIAPQISTQHITDLVQKSTEKPLLTRALVKTNTPELNYLDSKCQPFLGLRKAFLTACAKTYNSEEKLLDVIHDHHRLFARLDAEVSETTSLQKQAR